MEEVKKYEKIIEDYIKDKYNNLEITNIGNNKNIERHTKPIMSQFVENAIAILLNKIIDNKKYKYLIDAQFSVKDKSNKSVIIRPDIIIYDEENCIKSIIEVKSQLGYAGRFDEKEYYKKIKLLKTNNLSINKKDEKGKNKEKIYFKISEKCKDYIVILMGANDHGNKDKFKGTNYFLLYKDADGLWYNTLSSRYMNDDKDCGFEAFINTIKKEIY